MPKKRKFHGIKSVFNLISYGLEVDFYYPKGKKRDWPEEADAFVCRDFASDKTGEIVWTLLLQISNGDWDNCVKTISKIKKSEGIR